MIIDQIIRAQQGDAEAMEQLVTKFEPLLKKYSRKLFWEDALSDLTLAFLELIHGLQVEQLRCREDGALVNYLARSIYNAYLALLRDFFHQPKEVASLDDATEALKYAVLSYEEPLEAQRFFDLLDGCPSLTEKERFVLTQIYYGGHTAVEVAKAWSTSKQNINQIKQRGLKKLRAQAR